MEDYIYIADIRSNVINGKSTGHFIPVARMYKEILQNDCNLKIAGGPIYKKYFNEESLFQLPYNISNTRLKDKILSMKNCIKLFKQAKGETIILQQASVITAFIGILLFYHKKSKLFLIQYSTEGVKSPIGKFIYKHIKHKIDGVICPNDEVGKAFDRPYCVVPDYLYTNTENKNSFTKYEEKKYDFCMIGRMCREKGMLEAAHFLRNQPYQVLIAGRPENEQLAQEMKDACHNAPNITLIMDYISEEDYKRYLNESRYCILNYSGEYSQRSSGVVFDTLFADVPVIGRECKALDFIKQKRLGLLFNNINNFVPDVVLSKEKHEQYINNIKEYRLEHHIYIKKLIQFVNIK